VPGQSRLHRGPELPYDLLAGVVPVPKGWLVASGKLVGIQVHPEPPSLVARFRDVIDNIPAYRVIAVTLPIGLPTEPHRGGRAADHEARRLLGFPHAGAIGSTPTRGAVAKRNYAAARAANGGRLDVVTWQQFRKIRELDDEMEPYLQRQVYEVRPELSFLQLNEDVPMRHSKDTQAGQRERQDVLRRRMPGCERILSAALPGVRLAHLTDAAVTLWTARRIVARAVSRVPENAQWDDNGLRMEILR
jgi:predicted RNase H-like nuclease